MKKSNFTFEEGFDSSRVDKARLNGDKIMVFDWDKASEIIKKHYKDHKDLLVEAGLQTDWEYTGGVIFKSGEAITDSYTYLASLWATPTMILSWGGKYQKEIECYTQKESRFDSGSTWDNESLAILKY